MPGFLPIWLPGPHSPIKRSSLQPSLGSFTSQPQILLHNFISFISLITFFLFWGSSYAPHREEGKFSWGEMCFSTKIPRRGAEDGVQQQNLHLVTPHNPWAPHSSQSNLCLSFCTAKTLVGIWTHKLSLLGIKDVWTLSRRVGGTTVRETTSFTI